jgi:ABC-2 type transport system permease protein
MSSSVSSRVRVNKNNSFNFSRAYSIAKKEFRHLLRDPFTLTLALGLPIALLIFFGFAIDYDIKDIHIGVFDGDLSIASRNLVDIFQSSGYFKTDPLPLDQDPLQRLDTEKEKAILIINPKFGRHLAAGKAESAQIVLDGADNLVSGIISEYLAGIEDSFNSQLPQKKGIPPPKVQEKVRYLFNPELNSHWFFVPGLIAVINGLISILLTALTVAREWENGSMEMLLSTPVQPSEIILGKLAPYAVLGIGGVFLVFIAARFIFGVPMNGSYLLLSFSTLAFLAATLAQGLLISVLTRQQQLAMQIAITTGLLPAFLLSGFIFPVQNMPIFFRYLTSILSVRWFMQILRPVFLRGSGFLDLQTAIAMLSLLTALLIIGSIKGFKRDLEP